MLIYGEGKPTHTLVPCWMIATLLPTYQCTGCLIHPNPHLPYISRKLMHALILGEEWTQTVVALVITKKIDS